MDNNQNKFYSTDSFLKKEGGSTQKNDFAVMIFLDDFGKAAKKFWWILVALLVVCASAFFAVSRMTYSPRYKAMITFSIVPLVSGNANSGVSVYNFNYNDTLAKQTAATFPYVLESGILQDMVQRDVGYHIGDSIISAKSVGTTNIFELTVDSWSSQSVSDIIQSLIRNFPKISEHIMGDIRVHVITDSGVSDKPYNEKSYLIYTLLGALLGLLIGALVLVIHTAFRNTIRRRRDVVEKLNQRCVGEIPFVDMKTNPNENKVLKIGHWNAGFSESIRGLRKRVNDEILLKDIHVIGVTSAGYGEGKTTIAYNLAQTMSGGKRVLLLDMDFYHRAMKQYVKDADKNSLGVTNVISGKENLLQSAIHHVSDNMDVILSGNENVKFRKNSFDGLFEYARQNYDCVIVDLPPSAAFETPQIADLCDSFLFVVRWDFLAVDKILSAIRYMAFSKADMMGVVLNRAMSGFGEYAKYKSYSHYSRYRYAGSGYSYRYTNYAYGSYGKKDKK